MGSKRGKKMVERAHKSTPPDILGDAGSIPSFSLLLVDMELATPRSTTTVCFRDYNGKGIRTCADFEHPGGGVVEVAGVHSQKSTIHQVTGGVDHVQHGEMGCNASGFLDVVVALEEEMLNVGENSTKQKNNWARKKFDAWREFSGIDSSIALEKLDLHTLNGLLSKLFLVVCKKRGDLFPSDTLMGMLRCFGRLLKKEQDLRIAKTGVTEVPFDIARNPIFKGTQNSVMAAMRRSIAQGVCKDRKKASVIGVSLEQAILGDIDFSIMHGWGCQMRFAFFCMLHFCIRGGYELYKLERTMFSSGKDELGAYVRFCERSSKNYKVDLNHFQPEHFRPPVTVRDEDVLARYEQLMRHMPIFVLGDKNLGFMFLQPINNPRTHVWYSRNRVSVKVLTRLVKSIGARSGLPRNFSNKSLRNTCVTRMSLGQVPREVGMLITGHKRLTSYERYDMSNEVRMAATQKILSDPYDESRKLKVYPQVLEKKFINFCENIEGNTYGKDCTSGSRQSKAGNIMSVGNMECGAAGDKGLGMKNPSLQGIVFKPYKIGDEIPFDEELLNHLPEEMTRVLNVAAQNCPSRGFSLLSAGTFNNCDQCVLKKGECSF
ncbi:hypothetical protein GOP47_0011304 [Adiantum capillus-veneris]|uniref:Tyr recombinase domain-containing protein n=1 Tax=Adiantum capillus-veneris TaxID=13818 RepID=A0A9D4UT09_ADICA|nr:hypothetical protein GOP47_0011304 [Adiantum capillus-veneris]